MKHRVDVFWLSMIVLGGAVALVFWGWDRGLPTIVEYALFLVIFLVAGQIVIRAWIDFFKGPGGEGQDEMRPE